MTVDDPTASPRRTELLGKAYAYALRHGLGDLSLRPLAAAVGSSPRVLLFLFGSKEGLIRALLARAREEELAALQGIEPGDGAVVAAQRIWHWLAAPEHRSLLALWVEGYGRSLVDGDGPWAAFASETVQDWLAVLAQAQPPAHRRTAAGRNERTLILAVLRGAVLDLLATGDSDRVGAAIRSYLRTP